MNTKRFARLICNFHLRSFLQLNTILSQLFQIDQISAYLHDVAYEASPQRVWQAFLGTQHTLVTSWQQLRAYEVYFGHTLASTPKLARYVQGVMPRMDGLVQVMDIGDSGDFDISLSLETSAMARLLRDSRSTAFL